MRLQIFIVLFSISLVISCQEKDSFSVPTETTEDNTETFFDCTVEWMQTSGVWIDPKLCLAWSEKSAAITWGEAVSLDDSDDQDSMAYCDELVEGGFSHWRVPTIEELKDLSLRSPPFDDITGDLWSSSLDQSTGLVDTVNLEQPGMTMLLEPSELNFVRCVAEKTL